MTKKTEVTQNQQDTLSNKSVEELIQMMDDIKSELANREKTIKEQLKALQKLTGSTTATEDETPVKHDKMTVDDLKTLILAKIGKGVTTKTKILEAIGKNPSQPVWGDAIKELGKEKKLKIEGKGRGMTIVSL